MPANSLENTCIAVIGVTATTGAGLIGAATNNVIPTNPFMLVGAGLFLGPLVVATICKGCEHLTHQPAVRPAPEGTIPAALTTPGAVEMTRGGVVVGPTVPTPTTIIPRRPSYTEQEQVINAAPNLNNGVVL